MAKCEFCDKGVVFGIRVSHSHRRSNRPWKPNVKRVKAIVNGTPNTSMCAPDASVRVRSPALCKFVKKGPAFGWSLFSWNDCACPHIAWGQNGGVFHG